MHRIFTSVVIAFVLLSSFTATRIATAEELDYPRLAMWYPGIKWNTWKDAAQFDLFVGDFNETGGFLDRNAIYTAPILRGYNMDAKLFTYYTSGVVRHASLANEMLKYRGYMGDWPDEWFLTEAGTTTAAEISATATTIRVTDWDQTGPAKGNRPDTWPIFRVEYDILCGGEIMRVIGADFPTKTLTVARGVSETTETAHPAGTRIAPILRFWAGSYMMNLTASCPSASIHGATTAENWADYSFRLSHSGMTPWFNFIGGDQDGFMLDFMGDEVSWIMWQLARSIDLNHDNLPDEFDAMDADWQAGIDYITGVFHEKYPDAPLIRNNSRGRRFANYDGENFENWPSWQWDAWDLKSDQATSLTKYWHRNFFGEVAEEGDPEYEEVNVVEVGGIIEFCELGGQPNFSMVYSNEVETDLDIHGRPVVKRKGIDGVTPEITWAEVNQRDFGTGGIPPELSLLDPDIPLQDINWLALLEPDYQKMRWGLTTALLAGSYYCYTINSDGHGQLGLRWFDEYDDAGTGKGYLGQPVGDATQLTEHPDNSDWGVWGREYSGGYVVVNPTGSEVSVPLPAGNWRRINGTQQPEVNTGALETGSVAVAAFDGLILKRVI